MKASKTLAKPEYWQDFENLCKKLWGEIWKCPEIKKNGRSGQDQAGVDIYGMPHNETEYYGIQCKGKDEYTHKQLTEKEIDAEIEKAKKFEPKLKKLYFATTAIKDAKIEAFVRVRNVEHKESNQFEIHLFCWEDIVDLINDNKQTYDYYVNSHNYNSQNSVSVLFDNNTNELTVSPKFYSVTVVNQVNDYLKTKMSFQESMVRDLVMTAKATKFNYSYVPIIFQISNTGITPIENYKLEFEFEGDLDSLADFNIVHGGIYSQALFNREVKPFEIVGSKVCFYTENRMLVSGDKKITSTFFLKSQAINSTIKVQWKLLSKNLKDQGELMINVNAIFISKREINFVDHDQTGTEHKIIDCIESEKYFDSEDIV